MRRQNESARGQAGALGTWNSSSSARGNIPNRGLKARGFRPSPALPPWHLERHLEAIGWLKPRRTAQIIHFPSPHGRPRWRRSCL
jgi:hypothetical protein